MLNLKPRLYRTVVVMESRNDFIEGKISGILYAVAKEYKERYCFGLSVNQVNGKYAVVFTTYTNGFRYKKAAEIIKTAYSEFVHMEFDVDIMEFLGREG